MVDSDRDGWTRTAGPGLPSTRSLGRDRAHRRLPPARARPRSSSLALYLLAALAPTGLQDGSCSRGSCRSSAATSRDCTSSAARLIAPARSRPPSPVSLSRYAKGSHRTRRWPQQTRRPLRGSRAARAAASPLAGRSRGPTERRSRPPEIGPSPAEAPAGTLGALLAAAQICTALDAVRRRPMLPFLGRRRGSEATGSRAHGPPAACQTRPRDVSVAPSRTGATTEVLGFRAHTETAGPRAKMPVRQRTHGAPSSRREGQACCSTP
jgi:hypothetical protein